MGAAPMLALGRPMPEPSGKTLSLSDGGTYAASGHLGGRSEVRAKGPIESGAASQAQTRVAVSEQHGDFTTPERKIFLMIGLSPGKHHVEGHVEVNSDRVLKH